ncbi:hypothetical protein Asppvi_009020 [Aspergillus pseudoviridinutans]|uniref:Kinesin light chain n=1 Tax=Aspergillus pseudoviridinutans TaxID=1517512 RepID=A0A9P3EVT6_9EURO|nr:uncharacterized protein Asppvi_009020 [Aspergillus pseudoviridinutans]GIJ90071.1 hypothetical protein Asppvi_009020 [Aspergillus pseudoviridinutans]
MHPVVQDTGLQVANADKNVNSHQLDELTMVCVGYTVPSSSGRNYYELSQRLIPHENYICHGDGQAIVLRYGENSMVYAGLYDEQGKLKEAEEMCQRAMSGKQNAVGPGHTSTLDTVNNLGSLYADPGKLKEAEEMYQRALAGGENL